MLSAGRGSWGAEEPGGSVTTDFRHDVNEIFALLGCHVANIGSEVTDLSDTTCRSLHCICKTPCTVCTLFSPQNAVYFIICLVHIIHVLCKGWAQEPVIPCAGRACGRTPKNMFCVSRQQGFLQCLILENGTDSCPRTPITTYQPCLTSQRSFSLP